jgi:hypothetical protein
VRKALAQDPLGIGEWLLEAGVARGVAHCGGRNRCCCVAWRRAGGGGGGGGPAARAGRAAPPPPGRAARGVRAATAARLASRPPSARCLGCSCCAARVQLGVVVCAAARVRQPAVLHTATRTLCRVELCSAAAITPTPHHTTPRLRQHALNTPRNTHAPHNTTQAACSRCCWPSSAASGAPRRRRACPRRAATSGRSWASLCLYRCTTCTCGTASCSGSGARIAGRASRGAQGGRAHHGCAAADPPPPRPNTHTHTQPLAVRRVPARSCTARASNNAPTRTTTTTALAPSPL